MTTKTLTQADLAMFTGSEQFYRHSINRKVVYTEGARHVAKAGGALNAYRPCHHDRVALGPMRREEAL